MSVKTRERSPLGSIKARSMGAYRITQDAVVQAVVQAGDISRAIGFSPDASIKHCKEGSIVTDSGVG